MLWLLIIAAFESHIFVAPRLCRDGMNEYFALTSMRRGAQDSIPAKERRKKAADAGTRVRKAMESSKFASFDLEMCYFWTIEGSKECRKPLREWELHEKHEVRVASSANQVAAHVRINGKPLYDYFYRDGRAKEFKHPWNGVGGQTAEYKSDGYFHLRDGVESRLDLNCHVASLLTPYVGVESALATPYEASIGRGDWLGVVSSPNEEKCDLVCVTADPDEQNGQWDYYLINEQGWILQKYRIRAINQMMRAVKTDRKFNRIVLRLTFENLSTKAPEAGAFEPSSELLELSKDWKDQSAEVKAAQ
jgi:hypothetical protein